jgi:hypothetical protein
MKKISYKIKWKDIFYILQSIYLSDNILVSSLNHIKGLGMIKKIVVVIALFFSVSSFACPRAVPTDNVGFCASFKSAATCYCTSSGLPGGMCQDMNQLYLRMLSVFGTLQKACEYQNYTSAQDCMNNWNCYLRGGVDSTGKSCSSTKKACQ